MGFGSAISSMVPDVISKASGFVTDFGGIMAIIVGIAVAGYALQMVRRFI